MPQACRDANILLVDDNPADLLALEAVLAEWGQYLVKAQSGEEALRLLEVDDFAVVLLDVQMQGFDGFETAERIRQQDRSRHTPIIFLTGYDDHRFPVEQAYALGAVDYLVKPLVPAILRAKVAVFVELFQTTEQLRLLERDRFRAIIENSYDALALIDAEGVIRYASPSTTRILGYTPEEFVGRSVFELMHPDDIQRSQELFEDLLQRRGGSATSQYRYRHKDGAWRWIEGTGTNLLSEPSVRAIVANYRDITEQRQAEEQLHNQQHWLEEVLNLTPTAKLFIEPDTAKVVFANRAANEMAGGEFPKGKAAEEYHTVYCCTDAEGNRIPDEQMPGVRVARGERLEGFEVDWHTPQGKRSLLINADTLPAMYGHPATCLMNFQDISRLKQVEADLRQANQDKDNFISMLAHELRNPLSPVLSGLHILRLSGTDPQAAEQALGMMERQVLHMARLIDDLLDVSRVMRGKIKLRRERLDLGRLVCTAVDDQRHSVEKAGLAITVNVPDTPVWVMGDDTRLSQVLHNLMDNAIKFTDEGGSIEIRLRADTGGPSAAIHVCDSGIGMDGEMLARLFEPFSQADRSLDRTKGGLGLGLALIKGLTEMHGGQVEAHSLGIGRGTEFIVQLPIEPEPAALTETPKGATPTPRPRRVLIIEDNRDAADMLRMLLELLGHEVRVAYTGPEGVEEAKEWSPEIIVSDIGLPGLDGYGVARELRQNPATAKLKLIAVTGYGDEEARRRAHESGFNYVVTKPAEPAVLMQLLTNGA